jgi:hypothetical protein
MKLLIIFLLLGNALLFAYFNLLPRSGVALQIASEPLSPEKIRLLSPQEASALPLRSQPVLTPLPMLEHFACYEWGTFPRAKLEGARSFLRDYALDVSVIQQTALESRRYWVYVPPMADAAAAQTRADELRQRGVTELYVVQDDQFRNAISLGVFKDEQLAAKLLEELKRKGVVSAVKGVRNQEQGRVSLFISNMSSTLVPKLEKLKPEYPGSELKQVTCR